jgi:UDP-N-acetyl-D-mannosaminuronate dehydrogenase
MERKDFLKALKTYKEKICVVGLGYVGLPLAVSLAEHFKAVQGKFWHQAWILTIKPKSQSLQSMGS